MDNDDFSYIASELNKTREELLAVIAGLRRDAEQKEIYFIENRNSLTVMSKEFRKVTSENKDLRTENRELKETITRISEMNKLKLIDIYGRGSEKLDGIIDNTACQDEIDEDHEETAAPAADDRKARTIPFPIRHGYRPDKPKQKVKREADLSKLPQEQRFILDIEGLDEKYGRDNWRIAFWKRHVTAEHDPAVIYALNTYTPVISAGLEHVLFTVPYEQSILKRSFASPSLVADIIFKKYFLAVPLYRQETAFSGFGFELSRQTMSNWLMRFAPDLFGPVYDHMQQRLLEVKYHQCDETTLRVNKDGRAPGSKSYIWVHITSELLDTAPIVLFCYELTRGTDHLRKFYEDFSGFITCDAYCSYQVLGKENQNVIIICGCMMHMRRRYAQSLMLIDTEKLTDDEIQALPETKALEMIGKIYAVDEPLKCLSADERKKLRDLNVRPLVEEYYEYIESIDTDDALISARLKDAITYSKNQKEYLCRFLSDGNIPIDDGATERHIRPFAIGRNNFLFCDSVAGAETSAIIYTMVETAKANKANVYWYIRYLLEEMPCHMEDKDRSFLDRMVPWSEEYRQYEMQKTAEIKAPPPDAGIVYDTKPSTPKKRSRRSEVA